MSSTNKEQRQVEERIVRAVYPMRQAARRRGIDAGVILAELLEGVVNNDPRQVEASAAKWFAS